MYLNGLSFLLIYMLPLQHNLTKTEIGHDNNIIYFSIDFRKCMTVKSEITIFFKFFELIFISLAEEVIYV